MNTYTYHTLQHPLSFTESKFTPIHTHTPTEQKYKQTIQAAFPFFNYILQLNTPNTFSLQTAELINNRLFGLIPH